MKNILKFTLLAFIVFGFVSCLKDKNFDEARTGLDLSKADKIIELARANNSATGRTVGLAYVDQVVNPEVLTVRLASSEPATEDIKITIDTTGTKQFLDTFNVKNLTDIKSLPISLFTFPNGLVLTILKGTREASLKIRTNAIQYNTSITYGFYFSIVSVDKPGYIISQNYGKYFTRISAKNDYDGIYLLKCRMRAPSNDRPAVNVTTPWTWGGATVFNPAPGNGEVWLTTASAVSNDLFDDWGFGQVIQPIQTSTGAYSGFGFTQPRFTFDPATNKVVMATNTFVNPPNGRAFMIDPNPALDSKWDPLTRNVYVHFIMTQPGFQPLFIADTLLFKRDR